MASNEQRRSGGGQFVPRPTAWTDGDEAAWIGAAPTSAIEAAHAVAATATDRPAQPPTFPDARPSAVLVALVDGPTGAEVLLTKRSINLRHHAGEISFPGGRIDAGEDAVMAALREADEEVGLASLGVTVHGQLSSLSTVVSRSFILPVVATLAERPLLVPHDREVARIMWVPLVELTGANTYREERWGTPPLDRRMDFFELDDETIWGATARILRELLDVVHLSRSPTGSPIQGPPATRTAV